MLTKTALRAGFRAIDTANQRKHYFEGAVGNALTGVQKTLPPILRDQVFLQSKFTFSGGQDHRLPYDKAAPVAAQVAQSFESSLEHLHTDYLDSYLLHGPASRYGLSFEDWQAWRAMEALAKQGRVRLLGVSNMTLAQLELLCAGAKVQPAVVQNRCYASDFWDGAVREFCGARGILYQGFSLLTANRQLLGSPVIRTLQQRTGRSKEELVFAFATQIGICVLTGTSQEAHMQLDLAALDLRFAQSDLAAIETIAGA